MGTTTLRVMLVAAFLAAQPALAGEGMAPPKEAPNPAFERLKSLAGEWDGTASGAEMKGMATRATIKVVSAGSAVMLVTDPGGAHEMVTMIHRDDGGALVATHYCAAQNQPRMRAVPGADPTRIAFEFVDGTNLGAFPARMQRLVLVLPDPGRQIQEWTFRDGGKDATDTFDLRRTR